MAWSFDRQSRRFESSTGESMEMLLCVHLVPALTDLLAQGSTILAVLTHAWSEIDLDVTLDRGPAVEIMSSALPADSGVKPWTNQDPHYPLAQGLRCSACRQAIGWPIHHPIR